MVTNHVKSFVSVLNNTKFSNTKFEISKTSILKASMIVLILGALQKEYQKYVFLEWKTGSMKQIDKKLVQNHCEIIKLGRH